MVYASNITLAFRMAGLADKVLRYPSLMLLDHTYLPVSENWERANWSAWMDSLPKELKTTNNRGQQIPRYIRDAFDCENHAFGCMTHGNIGNALGALRTGRNAGLAKGVVLYTAEPRKANGQRSGRHAINWRMGHNSKIYWFEPADGTSQILTKTEIQSITTICAI